MLTAITAQNAVALVAPFSVATTGGKANFSRIFELFRISSGELGRRRSNSPRARSQIAPIERSNSLRTTQPQPANESCGVSATIAHKATKDKKPSSDPPFSLSPLKSEAHLARLAPSSSSEEDKVKLSGRRRAQFPKKKRKGSLRAHPAEKRKRTHTLARLASSRR